MTISIAEKREVFRDYVMGAAKTNGVQGKKFKQRPHRVVKRQIKAHLYTMKKYLQDFRRWALEYYLYSPIKDIKQLQIVKDYIDEDREPTITEVFAMFSQLQLKEDFGDYFINKTQLSYEIGEKDIDAYDTSYKEYETQEEYREHLERGLNGKGHNKEKFAEFVYLLLSEYIILHNYMWVSGYKDIDIKSIDYWLKDIK